MSQKISEMNKIPALAGDTPIPTGADDVGVGNFATDPDQLAAFIILDEDSFTSDSATKAPSQQSVKAYVWPVQGTKILEDETSIQVPDLGQAGFTLAIERVFGDDHYGLFFEDDGFFGPLPFFGYYSDANGASHKIQTANGIQLTSTDGDGSSITFNIIDTETVGIGARLTDNRTTKRGIEYAASGYVTGDRSLADKEYVDTAIGSTNSLWYNQAIDNSAGGTPLNTTSDHDVFGSLVDATCLIDIRAVPVASDGSESAAIHRSYHFRKDGSANPTLIADDGPFISDEATGANAVLSVSGANIRLTMTTPANQNYKWKVYAQIFINNV